MNGRKSYNKVLSWVLVIAMVIGMMPLDALNIHVHAAEPEEIVCEHHTEHTVDCGYTAAVEGVSCGHVHDENCGYSQETECTHTHDEACGYVAATEGTECTWSAENCAECAEKNAESEQTVDCICGTDDESIHATDCAAYVAPENPQCYCMEKCTADAPNVWCDVCGVQGADACQAQAEQGEAAAVYATGSPCDGTCNGTYNNGFCSICGGYQAAVLVDTNWYGIYNAGQLYWFAHFVNSSEDNMDVNADLKADIVVNEKVLDGGNLVSDTSSLRVWTPIEYYEGQFFGYGHSISGLYSCVEGEDVSTGLFKEITNATIDGVTIKDSYFEAINGSGEIHYIASYAGAIAARSFVSTIQNCYSEAVVKAEDCAGGITTFCQKHDLDLSLFCAILRQMDFERVQFLKNMEEYSEGQKKKVLLAASLLTPAHLYIWDEPLNYIDVFSRMQIEKLLMEYQPTMLFVEHDVRFRKKLQRK